MKKHLLFAGLALFLIAAYFVPLRALYTLAHSSDKYSQILIAPLLALFFLFYHRRQMVIADRFSFLPAAVTAAAGCVMLLLSFFLPLSSFPVVQLDFVILSFILVFTAFSILFYGLSLLASNRFPWLLLLLLLPLPTTVLDVIINFFRDGSAEVVDRLFQVTGVNYIRDGLTFHLPTLSIYIAKECSGIRSSTALVITGLLAGHLYLRTFRGKSLFMLAVIPLTILKNGIRITTLTILAVKFDHGWLDGSLHHKGGIVFFGLILLLFFVILILIQKLEGGRSGEQVASSR